MGNWSIPKSDESTPQPEAERFVWPPRQPVEVASDSPAAPPSPVQVVVTDPAILRPRPLRPRPSPTFDPTAILAPRSNSLASAVHDIERAWLDLTAAPLRERMLEEAWHPDESIDYCPMCGLTLDRDDAAIAPGESCLDCRGTRPPWQRFIRLGEYRPPLSRWVCEVKFTRWRRLGLDLGRLLGAVIRHEMQVGQQMGTMLPSPPLIVPVPTTFRRLIVRGIDHTLCIARGVAQVTGGTIVQPLARDHRPSQTRVAPSQRAANMAKAIRPKRRFRGPDLSGRLVIVLDDVLTTGATLRAAARTVGELGRINGICKDSGKATPQVWAAVVARTPPDAHDSSPDGAVDA
ncbi:MAG TPA: hypothetical protein VK146_05205 [Tabrizicola sp.]|nr:hypothetical protein [Tabrizicola sp.]